MFLTLFRNFCDMQEISKTLRMPLSSCETLFTHSNWKEKYELETSSCIVCLFCPKIAFCDVIIDSSHLVETVKHLSFRNISAGTCFFTVLKSTNFFNIGMQKWTTAFWKVMFHITMLWIRQCWRCRTKTELTSHCTYTKIWFSDNFQFLIGNYSRVCFLKMSWS